ncbi:MAG: 2-C-methyl-D-erythritol 4-phosphate cytidylyltransferase [Leptospiraceae bacterium]|nr:2-C-methyl-D-erythritol 4-phosphate cytidylyltransferase [Leptospiraceae bacterium]
MIHLVLLTGGTGSRMKTEVPKQFLMLRGLPVLEHSVRSFSQLDESVRGGLVLVSHSDFLAQAEEICEKYRANLSFLKIVTGGSTRHASSKNGLVALQSEINDDDLVLIHDGARPLVSAEEMIALSEKLQDQSDVHCATLAAMATETFAVAESAEGEIQSVPDRNTLFAIKTPQALRASVIKQFLASRHDHYTDLISWCLDEKLRAVMAPASERNIKLTHSGDLVILESLLDR